jgi:hypothetical protein
MRITMKQLFRLAPLLVGVIVVIGMLIFYTFAKTPIHNELYALDLVPKPETLTELYISNQVNLPNPTTPVQAVSFAFVIHNLEATDFQYTYAVSVDANGVSHVVDHGKVLVKNNQYYTRNEKFSLMKYAGSQKVVIELTNKLQVIDFWVRGN